MTGIARHRRAALALAACLAAPGASVAAAQEPPAQASPASRPPAVDWQQGPASSSLGSRAEIRLPAGYRFASAGDTRKLLESMGNIASGRELGFIVPAGGDWFVVFEFSDSGYVKDDEKDKLDADKILASIRKGTDASNVERKKRGFPPMEVVGWQTPPRYNPETHNLEWAIEGRSAGEPVINYNTRLLGRHGVMEVSLVCDPGKLETALVPFRSLLEGFGYKSGEKYSEFRQGDRIAAYGLTALATGAAAAVAIKTGILQKLLKPLLVALAAGAAAVKRAFARLFGRKDSGQIRRG